MLCLKSKRLLINFSFVIITNILLLLAFNLYAQQKTGSDSIKTSDLNYLESEKSNNQKQSTEKKERDKLEAIKPFSNEKIPDNTLQATNNIIIHHISKDIEFKKGLTYRKYFKKIKEKINKEYPSAFENLFAAKFFIKTLAEIAYSHNGTIPASDFNAVVEGRNLYAKVDKYINKSKLSRRVKLTLKKLLILKCIYTREITNESRTIKKLSKIPENSEIFVLKESQENIAKMETEEEEENLQDTISNEAEGKGKRDYPTDLRGNNLYYICSSYYPNFTKLSSEKQKKVLDYIYSFNPTVIISSPIKRDYYFVTYLKNLILPAKEQSLLTYSLHPETGWLILPKNLDSIIKKNN